MIYRSIICALAFCVALQPALAEGDPTRRAVRLDPLLLDARTGFSIKEYALESGVYYRWSIESDGLEEYKLVAPEFFPQIWVDQVVIEDKEVKTFGLHALEFDDEGIIELWFVPIRPGSYEFYIDHLAEDGFRGVFNVK